MTQMLRNSLLLVLASLTLLLPIDSFVSLPISLSNKPSLRMNTRLNARHYFSELDQSLSVSDKYFLVHSLINHIVLHNDALIYDYCYKNLNYTDIMHVIVSRDLEHIVKKHYYSKSTLELFDIISANAKLTDCYMHIHRLNI